ncbi:MAG: amylo-alpha-1,6-glucosidase [Chloroflexi bacterium]|nr:amylo-alpha-1,6-glucosidase [Chloroflexota bacterium]
MKVLKHGDLFLLSDGLGDVHVDSRGLGLYEGDTRILSCLLLRLNGERPVLLRGDTGANHRGVIQMTNPDTLPDQRRKVDPRLSLARESLGITRERVLDRGFRERITLTNFSPHREHLRIDLRIAFDAADIFEVRGRRRPSRGEFEPIVIGDGGRLRFGYVGLDARLRSVFVHPHGPARATSVDEGEGSVMLTWDRVLAPGARAELGWSIWSRLSPPRVVRTGRRARAATAIPIAPKVDPAPGAEAYRVWLDGGTTVKSDNELFDLTIRRSFADLRFLLNEGPGPGERYVAAGVPWYATLFGRDAILTGYEALAFRPSIAIEALEVLAARQATSVDDSRDAQPGKILHELRTGEMARAGELPHTPYYGSVDSTPLWLILLCAAYDWTGDRALIDRLWPNAIAALDWIDRYGTDEHGFLVYERRAPEGLINQGWKDSGDSVRDRAGGLVDAPIALAEVQGYVYDAKRRIAGLARVRGDDALAARLEQEAETLRRRFEAAFWVADRGYYAMAIGRDGRLADAITSNPAQALWTGIVDPDRAAAVVAMATSPGLDSGWGIRTYAAGQPGYNPIGYHTGSVWPHDTALIVDGLRRYGFRDVADVLAGKVLEAAQSFPDFRLPELFCGFSRAEVGVPVPYPVACSPQAWSAGAPLLFLTALLGLRPNAHRRELELVNPQLPSWLTSVTISDLRVGSASVDLLFHRWRGTTSAEVLRKRGDLSVTIRI